MKALVKELLHLTEVRQLTEDVRGGVSPVLVTGVGPVHRAQVEAALAREAEAIRGKLPASALLVAMCVEGKLLSSEELSDFLERRAAQGASHVVFVIGGSFGLHPSIKERAELRLSMSPMTFPHHLARVMVLEQIYRACQIAAGTKYHK